MNKKSISAKRIHDRKWEIQEQTFSYWYDDMKLDEHESSKRALLYRKMGHILIDNYDNKYYINYSNKQNLYNIRKKLLKYGSLKKIPEYKTDSQYSTDFWIFWGWDETYSKERVAEFQSNNAKKHWKKVDKDSYEYKKTNPVFLEYYLSQGLNEVDAKKALSERQSTFSLDKCIERFGEEEGTKVFNARQEQWQKTLSNLDNIDEINKKKGKTKKYYISKYGKDVGYKIWEEILEKRIGALPIGYSKISQKLFHSIHEKIKDKYNKIYFAELGNKVNNEYFIKTKNSIRFLDFYIKDINVCIEFDGDYWHDTESDKMREKEILEKNSSLKIIRIKENDYRKKEKDVLEKCLSMIEKFDLERNS